METAAESGLKYTGIVGGGRRSETLEQKESVTKERQSKEKMERSELTRKYRDETMREKIRNTKIKHRTENSDMSERLNGWMGSLPYVRNTSNGGILEKQQSINQYR